MVRIEIGVLRSQCLDRRIDDKETILTEVAAWEERRNAKAARIQVDVHHREGSRKAPQSLSRQESQSLAAVLDGHRPFPGAEPDRQRIESSSPSSVCVAAAQDFDDCLEHD
jgi:hypothetical protein